MLLQLVKHIHRVSTSCLVVLCIVCLSCESDTPGTPQEDPVFCARPDTVDFGIVTVGSSSEETIVIENRAGGTLSGRVSVSTSAPCDGYSIISGHGDYSLTSGQTHDVIVRFEPASTGTKTCRIETGNSACADVELVASAEVPPVCLVEPSTVDLGLVNVGSPVDTSFTITNAGGGFLSGTVREQCDPLAIIAGGGAYSLSAGESRNVTIRFNPTSPGAQSCTVETGNELCSDVSITAVTESPRVAGTVVGHDGTILRTTDGGTSWTKQNGGTFAILVDASFSDETTGTIVGQFGTILRTSNGGATWTKQTSGTSRFLTGVSFTDENNGTAVGQLGTILRTTDGGITWESQVSGTSSNLTRVSFVDANTGTAVGWDGVILRTTDGGANWSPQDAGTQQFFGDVCFVDANFGVAVTAGTAVPPPIPLIVRTTNGGENWSMFQPLQEGALVGVAFTTNSGIVAGGNGEIFRSTDGGTTWSQHASGVTQLNDVDVVDGNIAVAVGAGGKIVISDDGGVNWISRPSGTSAILRGVSIVRY